MDIFALLLLIQSVIVKMLFEKAIIYMKSLEDPKNPVLGPTLKALSFFGVFRNGSKLRTILYDLLHFTNIFFVFSEFVYLYSVKHDFNQVFDNMSLPVLGVICVVKCYSIVLWRQKWMELFDNIAKEEIFQLERRDFLVRKYIRGYIKYTRNVTHMYWLLIFGTHIFMLTAPFIKYLSSHKYREEIKSSHEPLPQIFMTCFPFDSNKMPGYLIGIIIHIIMGTLSSGLISAYDMNAVAIMSYLKGQMLILEQKCNTIFEELVSSKVIIGRIKECHRHHNVLMKQYKMFNALLSPTMFIYVLLCSISICTSVIQFSSKQASSSQKIWAIASTLALVTQLFLYCWHGNEVMIQSLKIERSIYNSDWWRGDVQVRKQLLLLAGKLKYPFILTAGNLTTLSVSTFITIMNRSYSFYTLMSQIQDDKVI